MMGKPRLSFALAGILILAGCVDRDVAEAPTKPAVPGPMASAAATPIDGYTAPAAYKAGSIVVQPHQTLYAIARQTGVPLRALIDSNHLEPPYRVNAGQRLTVPQIRTHIVQSGETLYQVSRRYGVEATTLAQINHMPPPYVLKLGTPLILPPQPGSGQPATPSVASMPNTPPVRGGRSAVESAPLAPPSAAANTVQKAGLAPPPLPEKQVAALPKQPDDGADLTAPTPLAAPVKIPSKTPAPRPAVSPPIDLSEVVRNHRAPVSPIFYWPARGTIIAVYGPTKGGTHNDGINIAAPEGTVISAAESGVVAYAGDQLKGFGNLLLIKHEDGWVSAYAHNQVLLVAKGQHVRRGQPIARIGSSGGVSQPQLHFELRQGVRAIDPLDHLPQLTAVSG